MNTRAAVGHNVMEGLTIILMLYELSSHRCAETSSRPSRELGQSKAPKLKTSDTTDCTGIVRNPGLLAPWRLLRSTPVHASDLPKHRLVFGDERYSPKSGMRAYPIASYSFIAGARRVPVSSTILVTPASRASHSRA